MAMRASASLCCTPLSESWFMATRASIEFCGARMSCEMKRSVSSRLRSACRMTVISVRVATVPAKAPSSVRMGAHFRIRSRPAWSRTSMSTFHGESCASGGVCRRASVKVWRLRSSVMARWNRSAASWPWRGARNPRLRKYWIAARLRNCSRPRGSNTSVASGMPSRPSVRKRRRLRTRASASRNLPRRSSSERLTSSVWVRPSLSTGGYSRCSRLSSLSM